MGHMCLYYKGVYTLNTPLQTQGGSGEFEALSLISESDGTLEFVL
jgi:hypothetical protein